MGFRFVITPVLSLVPIGELELSSVSWNDPVFGAGGQFSGKAEINNVQTVTGSSNLPNQTRLHCMSRIPKPINTCSAVPWLTTILGPWRATIGSHRSVLEVLAVSEALQMNMSTNPVTDVSYTQTAKDQFFISRALLNGCDR
jgi:hypothetical protein